MATIQIVLEESLLKEADRAVKRGKTNRSALIRDALREHLRNLHLRELEEQERQAYRLRPQSLREINFWAKAASWPEP